MPATLRPLVFALCVLAISAAALIAGPAMGPACLALAIWLGLMLARGQFWRCTERDETAMATGDPAHWPDVCAVIPARNEAGMIAQSVDSLLRQDYPGRFTIVLVDDNSEDATLAVARALAAQAPGRLDIVQGAALPPGWTGKLWAMNQGVARAQECAADPKYLLLSDADIGYRSDALRRLVQRAEGGGLVLVSLMARLRCESVAERALVPAFIFFFQMLYPFAWVNRPARRTAAAAGGCMLVRATALREAGGIAAIRGALIDDCALGARLKRQGPIWLGLAERVRSLRPYPRFRDIRAMVARSAYAQLQYSPWLLGATGAGMAIVYLVPPLATILAAGPARAVAAASWALMALAFLPTLRLYHRSPLWAPLLPAIAAVYLAFTVDSALQHARGRGGVWKGRAQAHAANGH